MVHYWIAVILGLFFATSCKCLEEQDVECFLKVMKQSVEQCIEKPDTSQVAHYYEHYSTFMASLAHLFPCTTKIMQAQCPTITSDRAAEYAMAYCENAKYIQKYGRSFLCDYHQLELSATINITLRLTQTIPDLKRVYKDCSDSVVGQVKRQRGRMDNYKWLFCVNDELHTCLTSFNIIRDKLSDLRGACFFSRAYAIKLFKCPAEYLMDKCSEHTPPATPSPGVELPHVTPKGEQGLETTTTPPTLDGKRPAPVVKENDKDNGAGVLALSWVVFSIVGLFM